MGGFLEEVTPDLSLKGLGMGRMGVGVAARRRDFWAGVASDTLKWTEYSSNGDSEPLGLLEKPRIPERLGSTLSAPPGGVRGQSPGW